MAALADTSIFLAVESGRALRPYDGELRISVATVTELEVGVALARNDAERSTRTATLAAARKLVPIPYDAAVGTELARLISALRQRRKRVPLFDAIVAATAEVHALTVYTQDRDFEVLHAVGGPRIEPAWLD